MLGVCKTANAGESLRASVGGSPDGGECCLLTLERPFIEGILGCGKFRFPPTDAGNLSKGFAQGCVLALELSVFQPSAPILGLGIGADTSAAQWARAASVTRWTLKSMYPCPTCKAQVDAVTKKSSGPNTGNM